MWSNRTAAAAAAQTAVLRPAAGHFYALVWTIVHFHMQPSEYNFPMECVNHGLTSYPSVQNVPMDMNLVTYSLNYSNTQLQFKLKYKV